MSSLLVIAQFTMIAWLALLAPGGQWRAPAMLAMLAGIVLGVAAIGINRPGNFNIRPEPKPGAKLATAGPYRLIRHPMYSAVMLCGAGVVFARPGAPALIAWLVLSAVLVLKALREERGLLRIDAAYALYVQRTRRFIPWLV